MIWASASSVLANRRSALAAPRQRYAAAVGTALAPRISRSHTAGSAARRCRRRKRRPRTGRGPGTAPLSPAWSGDQSRVRLRCQSCAMCSHPLPGAITSAVPTRPRPCRLRPVPLRHDHTAVDATRLLSRGAKADLAPGRLFLNLVVVRHNKDPSRRLGDHRLVPCAHIRCRVPSPRPYRPDHDLVGLRPVPLRHDHTAVDATRLLSRGAKADLAPGRL